MEIQVPKEKAAELIKKTICLINGWNYEWAKNKTIEEIKMDPKNPISWWRAKEVTQFYLNEILSNTPMYIGNLNPKWKFWNDVKTNIDEF